ncbi:hypothetical protein [Microvirga sp. G4-2]|uniref:hypothetical protein n=1 Tax=Microvirga sp. G4-2 TaxID=3434467 RepID=UPI004043ABCD
MRRAFLAVVMVLAGTSAAPAIECTKALQARWEAAMGEAMQLRKIHFKDLDQPTLCRITKNANELIEAGKDYFPACDPLDDDGRRVVLTKMETLLENADPSVCSPVGKNGREKKN